MHSTPTLQTDNGLIERANRFWATVCKMVCPLLSDRCPVCLSCTICNVVVLWPNGGTHEDETWHAVSLGPGHIVLDGDPGLPPRKGHTVQFSAHVCCRQMARWIKMQLGMKVRLGLGGFVLDGNPAPPPKKGADSQFLAHFYCAKRLDRSRCHLVWR